MLGAFESTSGERWVPRLFGVDETARLHIPDPVNGRILSIASTSAVPGEEHAPQSIPSSDVTRRLIYFSVEPDVYLLVSFDAVTLLDRAGSRLWRTELPLGTIPTGVYSHPRYVFATVPSGSGERTMVFDRQAGGLIGYLVDSSGGADMPMVLTPAGTTIAVYQESPAEGRARLVAITDEETAWYADGDLVLRFQLSVSDWDRTQDIELPLERDWMVFAGDAVFWSQATATELRVFRARP